MKRIDLNKIFGWTGFTLISISFLMIIGIVLFSIGYDIYHAFHIGLNTTMEHINNSISDFISKCLHLPLPVQIVFGTLLLGMISLLIASCIETFRFKKES